jgi:TPR repeat protein
VNPSPTILPVAVESAKKAKRDERPGFIVLDDADLIGTDPSSGLTAQRLLDLAGACKHLIVVVHEKALSEWAQRVTDRSPSGCNATGIGVTPKLMRLLESRVHYKSALDEDESSPAAKVYEGADPRVKSFDLSRMAETLAGVETLLANARKILQDPTGVEAALLEAAVDASVAFPSGATLDAFSALAAVHFRRRQPNRPWRPLLFHDAFDTLTTGITVGSPHAILVASDKDSYRLLDALTPELQHPDRDVFEVLKTIEDGQLPHDVLSSALVNTGLWHESQNQYAKAMPVWMEAAKGGSSDAVLLLSWFALGRDDWPHWLELAAESGDIISMNRMGDRAEKAGDMKGACSWWERAAEKDDTTAIFNLREVAKKAGDDEAVRAWEERAVASGGTNAMFTLGVYAQDDGDLEATRRWWAEAAEGGHVDAGFEYAWFAFRDGDYEVARPFWERALANGIEDAKYYLGLLSWKAGDLEAAQSWWETAAHARDGEGRQEKYYMGLIAEKKGT